MIRLDDEQVAALLPGAELAPRIERALRDRRFDAPERGSYRMHASSGDGGSLLVMPAWRSDEVIGLKIVAVWDSNHARGLPSHAASVLLLDSRTGQVRALLDGKELTSRRTAAVCAVATAAAMPPSARNLLVIGTGPTARAVAFTHQANHAFERIEIYARRAERAEALVAELAAAGIRAGVSRDLARSVAEADVISSATSATRPVLLGEWLSPGTHINLIGSFLADMREADDAVVTRADAIWVDQMAGALAAGDLSQPIADGLLDADGIAGDICDLLRRRPARSARDITMFKSAGLATADMIAAEMAVERAAMTMPSATVARTCLVGSVAS